MISWNCRTGNHGGCNEFHLGCRCFHHPEGRHLSPEGRYSFVDVDSKMKEVKRQTAQLRIVAALIPEFRGRHERFHRI